MMTVAPSKPTALVLDDQFLIAASIEACLAEIGFAVDVALSEAKALELLAARGFDVAVVDYRLAGGTSAAVCSRLTELGIPHALCSGSMGDVILEDRPNAVIIAKPFSDADIIAAVERLVGGGPIPRGLETRYTLTEAQN